MKDSDTPALPVTVKLLHHETFSGMKRRFIRIKNTSDKQTHYFFYFLVLFMFYFLSVCVIVSFYI